MIAQNIVFAAICHPSATTLHPVYLKTFPVIGGRVADKYTKKNFVRDLNNDGKMDAADIVIVVNILNGKLSYFSIKLLLI